MASVSIPNDCYTLAEQIDVTPHDAPLWFAARGWVCVGYDSGTGQQLYLPASDPRVEEARQAPFLFAGDYGRKEV